MKLSSKLLATNLGQVLMILGGWLWFSLDTFGYFASGGNETVVDEPTPGPEKEQFFLKYSLIGLSISLPAVVFVISIFVMARRKSKQSQSTSTNHGPSPMELSYEKRWEYIKKKHEEIKNNVEKKIAKIPKLSCNYCCDNLNDI